MACAVLHLYGICGAELLTLAPSTIIRKLIKKYQLNISELAFHRDY